MLMEDMVDEENDGDEEVEAIEQLATALDTIERIVDERVIMGMDILLWNSVRGGRWIELKPGRFHFNVYRQKRYRP